MNLHDLTIVELKYRFQSTLETMKHVFADDEESLDHLTMQRDQLMAVLASPTHASLRLNPWVGQLICDAIDREQSNLEHAEEPEDIASVKRELRIYKADMRRAFGTDWDEVMFEMLRKHA
jgi:hypothetical protein